MRRIYERAKNLIVPVEGAGDIVAAAPTVPVRVLFRRFWPYARPYRRWLVLSLILIVLGPAIETAEIWLFKLVVDDVFVPGDLAALVPIAIAYLTLTVVGGAITFGDEYVSTWVGERFLLSLRAHFFAHVQTLSLDVLDRRRLGDMLSRLTGDIQAIESLVLAGVADALSAVIRIAFFTGALFFLDWVLALVSLIVAPLFWAAARTFSRLIKRAAREKRRRSGALGAVAEEALSNAALVQAYNRQGYELERFQRENEGVVEAELAGTRVRGAFSLLVDLTELAGGLLVIAGGTWALSEGRLSLGGLLAFLAYLALLYGPIRDLSRLSNTIFAAAAGGERVIELLDERPRVREDPSARQLVRARGLVEIDDVSFAYPGSPLPAVERVSLRVEPGETLALVGPSGAGKSTLAKLMLRFVDPDRGELRLDGHDLRELELGSLRDSVGVLLQETLVFHGTVRENIAYGREGATDEEIVAAARAAGAHEFVERLPDGYDAVIGQKGRLLSGGQRQRIAIARALVREAPVLILDEPSAGLDADAAHALIELLRVLMDGRTTIVISHSLVTVRDATAIALLEHGRVREYGTHEELIESDGAYARLYRLHSAGRAEPAGLA